VAITETGGRFDSTSAVAVLGSACSAAGLESEDAELLRLGENAIFRLRDSACVVRIGRNMSHWADATKEVAVSGWLAAHEYPAAKALGLPQPLEVDGHPVTFWEYIDGRNGARQDVEVLAELLRDLHSLKAPEDFQLPEQAVLDRVRPRIESSQVSDADKLGARPARSGCRRFKRSRRWPVTRTTSGTRRSRRGSLLECFPLRSPNERATPWTCCSRSTRRFSTASGRRRTNGSVSCSATSDRRVSPGRMDGKPSGNDLAGGPFCSVNDL